MALLESKPPQLGAPMPPFALPDVTGKPYNAVDFPTQVLVVMFLCAHCPYVLAVEDRIVALRKQFQNESVQLVGICSNDPTAYPADAPAALAQRAAEKDYGFPYLVDETQAVAKALDAVCTPEFFVFNRARTLQYHGRLDDNWKDPTAVTQHELADAIQALLNGEQPAENQLPSMGCSIKWRA